MRLVVPFTNLRPETRTALDASGQAYETVRMHDDDSYFALLSGLWAAGETFAVVEQDIVIGPGTMPSLQGCAGDWCAFGYAYMAAGAYYGLGCTRFSAALLARVPDALDRVAVMHDETHRPRHWCRLDSWLSAVLRESGEKRCEHLPPVGHLNRYPSHGCAEAPDPAA